MGHEHDTPFELKHKGRTIDPEISSVIQKLVHDGRITCGNAHKAAETCHVSPAEIGVQIDLSGYRLTKCQLGLFGYKDQKRLDPDIDIPGGVLEQIEQKSDSGIISCKACWEIAENKGILKLNIGSACEKAGIKIKHCQLGAF